MVSGLAPGRLAATLIVGVDLRQRGDRQQRVGDQADEQNAGPPHSEVPMG